MTTISLVSALNWLGNMANLQVWSDSYDNCGAALVSGE
jgi:hypothetical protein